jgi:flavin-dependent dehydrogenase
MQYDVVIVGSGPAGTSTALHLVQWAPEFASRILVLERDHHPRHKLCGGGCTRDADVCLNRLGLDIRDVPHVDVPWVNLHFLGRGFRMRPSREGDSAFRVVRRSEFDAWLAEEARRRGVEVREGARVTELRRTDGGIAVETSQGRVEARVVVGADGVHSVVRRLVAPGEKSRLARLIEVFTPAAPPSGENHLIDSDAYLEFSCFARGVQGYVWSFPMVREGRSMRNWGAYDSRVVPGKSGGSLKPVVADWLTKHSHRLGDYRLESHPMRLFDRKGTFAAPNALLVGDAAGADPMFGEGISIALGYGNLAARAIHHALARGDLSFRTYREQVVRSPLGKSLRRRVLVAKLAHRLPYPLTQKLTFWRLGPLLRWYLQGWVFNWAERLEGPFASQERAVEGHDVAVVSPGKEPAELPA